MQALAIDLGGSHATCAIVDERSILASEIVTTDGTVGLRPVLPEIVRAFHRLLEQTRLKASDCLGLGFSFCGLVDSRTSEIVSTNQKYDDAQGFDLEAWAKSELGVRLRLENDARMALLGERYAGAGRGFDDIVMTTLGTGIGGAAMISGKLLRGKHAQAGCLGGHIPVLQTAGSIQVAALSVSGWRKMLNESPSISGDSRTFNSSRAPPA